MQMLGGWKLCAVFRFHDAKIDRGIRHRVPVGDFDFVPKVFDQGPARPGIAQFFGRLRYPEVHS